MDKITNYLSAAGGYARMKELRVLGFQTCDIAELLAQGHIERVKPGLTPCIIRPMSFDYQ